MTDANQVEIDLACESCGYNLRTLGKDAQCPECGVPVSKSLWNPSARWSQEYLSKVASAVGLAAGLNIAAVVLVGLNAAASRILPRGATGSKVVGLMLMGAFAGIPWLQVVVAYRLTARPPSALYVHEMGAIRGSAIVLALSSAVVFFLTFLIRGHEEAALAIAVVMSVFIAPSAAVYVHRSGRFVGMLCVECRMEKLAASNRSYGTAMAVGLFILAGVGVLGMCIEISNGALIRNAVEFAACGLLIMFCGGILAAVVGFLGFTCVQVVTAVRLRRLVEQRV